MLASAVRSFSYNGNLFGLFCWGRIRMDDDRMTAFDKYAELDKVVPGGLYCVGLTDEDIQFFEEHARELRAKRS